MKDCGRERRNLGYMSLDVKRMMQKGSMVNSECILCGTCADGCTKGVITYSFSRPKEG